MTLEQLEARAREQRAPRREYRVGDRTVATAADLASELRRQDEADSRRLRSMMRVLLPLGVFYTALFVLTWIAPPDNSPALSRFVIALGALLFLAVFFSARLHRDRLAGIDYAAPLRDFLAEAAQRFRFVPPRRLPALAGLHAVCLLLMFLASEASMQRYIPQADRVAAFAALAAVYLTASLAAYAVARRTWTRTRLPLLRRITSMQAELDAAS
jgi:hypothetical protein